MSIILRIFYSARAWSGEDWSLVLVAITHTYLLFHCAPYIGYMVLQLLLVGNNSTTTTTTVDSVGWYAGLLGTAFTSGRYLSFVPWRQLRLSVFCGGGGTKKVLLLSLILSALGSLWFGLSRTYGQALLARFFLGLSNTLSGCIKRIVMDRTKKGGKAVKKNATTSSTTQSIMITRSDDNKDDEEENNNNNNDDQQQQQQQQQHSKEEEEEMAPSLVLSIMMWGSALGPCMGGMLSNPGAYSKDTFLPDSLEDQYPFFLPNLVAILLCIASMIAVALFIVEDRNDNDDNNTVSRTIATSSSTPEERKPILLQQQKIPKRQQQLNKKDQNRSYLLHQQIWKSKNAQLHFLAYWTFSFVVVCIQDEALPLFLIARWSGPGLSPYQIGWILSTSGFLTCIYSSCFDKDITMMAIMSRIYHNLSTSAIMANLPAVLVPLLLVFNGGTYYQVTTATTGTTAIEEDEYDATKKGVVDEEETWTEGFLSWQSFWFLTILLSILRMYSSRYISLIGIATSRIVPASHRDEVSRIMTHGALLARAVAPVGAGGIVSVFMMTKKNHYYYYHYSACFLWTVMGLGLGLSAAIVTIWLEDTPMADNNNNKNAAAAIAEQRKKREEYYLVDQRQRAQIHIRLWEVHYDSETTTTVASKWRRLTRKVIAANRIMAGRHHHHDDDDDNNLDVSKSSTTTTPEQQQQKPSTNNNNRRTSWMDHILRPGLDLEDSFLILGTHKHDTTCAPHVLTPPLMKALLPHVPPTCADQNFWLRYSLMRDGDSIPALIARMGMSKNTIFAIETLQGDVFGCFMTYKWQNTGRYELCGESFLWRKKKKKKHVGVAAAAVNEKEEEEEDDDHDTDVYPWTGANDECQYLSNERIGVGGGGDGFGFIIEDGLWRGSSSPCQTYDNPSLVQSSSDGYFEVANIEVWSLTPHLFVNEAEKSEASRRFIMDHVDSTSVTSSWTKYI